MATKPKVYVFRAVNENLIDATGTVSADLIEKLFGEIRPPAAGESMVVIWREPGAKFYTVDTLRDDHADAVRRVLPWIK